MIRYLVCCLAFGILCLSSCGDKQTKYIDFALKQAGQNRAELEAVLEHYKNEPKKLRAARFLIANMPCYFTREGKEIDSLKQLKKESITRGRISDELIAKWKDYNYRFSAKKVEDVCAASAELLIENIDLAFQVWESRPWSKYYSFEEFCEYILPYRIEDEPLERWRAAYCNRYGPILDSLYQGTDVVEAAKVITAYLKREGFANYTDFNLPHLGALYLLENRVGYCRENCDIACYVMRAVGIPVATDRYHISPSYQSRHFWSALIDTTGLAVSFNYTEKEMERGVHDGRKKGKVYRQCFGLQREVFEGIYSDSRVPVLFRNPYIKDVTIEYFPENRIKVPINNRSGEGYAFLAVFNGSGFEPICIAKAGRNRVIFRNLENELIYQPVIYEGGASIPIGHPFLLKNSSPEFFVPDVSKRRAVTLTRKYPMGNTHKFLGTAVGVRIEGANRRDFKDARLLYLVVDTPMINYNKIVPVSSLPYRYIRYAAPEGKKIELAELAFFADSMAKVQLFPKSIFGEHSLSEVHASNLKLIMDNDWVSFYMSAEPEERLIFDFGKSQHIQSLVYIPRNDDNFIHLGDSYELFYQNGVKGWTSLGKQVAKTSSLVYKDVPDNTLLWLHNATRGKEERPFYYRDEQQIFP